MQAIYVLLVALFISMLLVPPLSRFAGRLGMTDQPGDRKIHSRAIPRTGGIAIVIGALTPILLWVPMRPDLLAWVLGSVVIFGFGILDDRFNLDYRLKLLGQLVSALVVVLLGGVLIDRIPFLGLDPLPGWLGLPLTLLVLVGLTNAVNLSDGLDGLAGGLSLLALGALAVLAYECEDSAALMVSFAIMGAIFGFLRFNTNPAQIFMGDTGSQFLGFSTAVIALIVTQRPDTAVSKVVPVLILGLPILDTLSVMIRRIADGRSPFSPDRLHLHHRLLGLGWNQYQAVVSIYGAQLFLILLAYVLRFSADLVLLAVYAGFSAGLLYTLCVLSVRASRSGQGPDRVDLDVDSDGRRSTELVGRYVAIWASRFLAIAVSSTLVAGAVIAPDVSSDVATLSGLLLVFLMLGFWLPPSWRFWGERLAAYVIAVAVVYFMSSISAIESHKSWAFAAFGLFGGLTAIWVRFSKTGFQVNSLDVLILVVAVVVPNLSAPLYERVGWLALGAIILFYAIEVLMSDAESRNGLLRASVVTALAILTLKGLTGL
ncbi:glycosyltransferase family 4 protein [Thiorhodococcus fuscus]|uniref:Glycosyltransferase family 4 protein n=1 Tax=Thiorhodococcus fuscus TaxID=527200 RepID=A0ABW4Y376_9GAMM